jgi:[ribosomal protein S5]-alanine N-acetyltransferase
VDVRLRPVRLDDWPAVHSWAQLEQACRFQAWGPNTPSQTEAFVAEAVRAWSSSPQHRFAYAALVDGAVLGLGELNVRNAAHRQGEIAYAVHPDRWGEGIATRVARELIELGFERLGLHRIFATCDPRNLASARVLERVGLSYEGRLREVMLIRDGWRDSCVFSILRREWSAPPT